MIHRALAPWPSRPTPWYPRRWARLQTAPALHHLHQARRHLCQPLQRLLEGDFPPGSRLGEERLAAEIGVSRTPIREALSRLHSEGLVERLPDGGFGPTLINLHLILELYEIRFALERSALRRTVGSEPAHDEDLVRALRADWADMDAPTSDDDVDGDFVLLDEDFHERLASAAGNRSLVDQLHKVNERIRIVRMQDFLTAERIERTISQHLGVLESAGLVTSKKTGRVRTFRLVPAPLTDASDWLGAQRDQWAARLDQLDEYLTRMDTT